MYKYLTSIATIIIILFVCIMSIITPDKDVSDLEGRKLQELPLPNIIINDDFNRNAYIYELLNGDMFKKWDSYFSDNFFKREYLVNSFTNIQNFLNKKYINDVYLGKDDYIFSLGSLQNNSINNCTDYFETFADRFINSQVYIVNLPQKNMVYENNLPIDNYKSGLNIYMDNFLCNISSDKLNLLDCRSVIDDKKNYFYKTDHHWNMNGTYEAYKYIINNIFINYNEIGNAKDKDEFKIKSYKNYFVGTDGRKVGQLVKGAEDLDIYYSNDFDNYKVYNQDGKFQLLHEEYLNKEKFNNDYMVYLGGDNPIVKIENTNSSNDLKIAMIGDSMDNSLVPLMASHFKELYSYDLRHYKEDIINELDNINPDIIILIGLSSNFLNGSDSEIFKWNLN